MRRMFICPLGIYLRKLLYKHNTTSKTAAATTKCSSFHCSHVWFNLTTHLQLFSTSSLETEATLLIVTFSGGILVHSFQTISKCKLQTTCNMHLILMVAGKMDACGPSEYGAPFVYVIARVGVNISDFHY